jgi:hypothetical protein
MKTVQKLTAWRCAVLVLFSEIVLVGCVAQFGCNGFNGCYTSKPATTMPTLMHEDALSLRIDFLNCCEVVVVAALW